MIRPELALLFAGLAACGSAPPASLELPSNEVAIEPAPRARMPDDFEHFHVIFAQGGRWVDTADSRVSLDRAPFVIVVLLREPGGVLVNVSEHPRSLEAAAQGRPIGDILGFGETGMAEWLFNKDREMFVVDEAPSYWYFETADDHRFDEPCETGKILVCRRTVERLAYRDRGGIPVTAAPAELFFVFAQVRWDGTERVEMARSYVTAEFL